jgi:hypothetical protein
MSLVRCERCGNWHFDRVFDGRCMRCEELLEAESGQQLVIFVPELAQLRRHDTEVVSWR